MAQRKIVVENAVNAGDLTFIPVVELSISHYKGDSGLYFFAYKNPVAVIMITETEKKLLIVDESSISVDKLLSEVPKLASILNS